jgi:phage virion morphogenesis protein
VAGIELQIDLDGLAPALSQLNRLGTESAGSDVLANIGALVESQTRRRISVDKTAPDGSPWSAWSPAYAATRRQGQSMLMASGGLLDSIAWVEGSDFVAVGSDLVYAAAHQFGPADGKDGPPARPWLGLSGEDEAEISDLLADLFGGMLQ